MKSFSEAKFLDGDFFVQRVKSGVIFIRTMRKPTMWFPNRSGMNQAIQAQKHARSLEFQIQEEEGLYYQCSENKGADQLRKCEAALRLCFRICRMLVFA